MLTLARNQIEKVEGLDGQAQTLTELHLSGNRISDEQDLAYLGNTLTKLEDLGISSNPLCPGDPGTEEFFEKVKAAIPQLDELNSEDINSFE